MPKLLNINTYHYRRGGSDVVYFEHAHLMEQQGFDNAFFAMHHPNNEASPWNRFFIDELEFGHAYSLTQKITMAAKAIYSFEAQKKLRQLLNEFRPDVAHLHCIYHHLSPSILPVLHKAGIPTVMTAHDLKIACPAYKMLNHTGICERCNKGSVLNVIKHRCIRGSLAASTIVALESGLQRSLQLYRRYLTKVVVPSQFFIEKFVEWGWPREQFFYVPNYVDAERFTPNYTPGDYFLYFGRLAPEKGVGTLIQAAAQAKVKLKIAGTGPEQESLRILNTSLGSPAEFLGFQSGQALHNLVQESRAVVLPSEWYENAPMSVLESMAMGKPVIGANIGGIPELITDDTGWIFSSGNIGELASQMTHVQNLTNKTLADMGLNARHRVISKFNKHGYTAAINELYKSLGVRFDIKIGSTSP
jgi:glycosyltransferase involved in cell wall biosynthesis